MCSPSQTVTAPDIRGFQPPTHLCLIVKRRTEPIRRCSPSCGRRNVDADQGSGGRLMLILRQSETRPPLCTSRRFATFQTWRSCGRHWPPQRRAKWLRCSPKSAHISASDSSTMQARTNSRGQPRIGLLSRRSRLLELHDFTTGGEGPATLLCTPYALHGAVVADLAPGHSLVGALRDRGVRRLFVADWRSATEDMRLLGIDDYLADLNVLIDEIGAPANLIGVCQGGWLALIYAARFPAKVRQLVLAGAPVDTKAAPSALTALADGSPIAGLRGIGSPWRWHCSRTQRLKVLGTANHQCRGYLAAAAHRCAGRLRSFRPDRSAVSRMVRVDSRSARQLFRRGRGTAL